MNAPRRAGLFTAFMLGLAVLFAALGLWQLQRLDWKLGLIAAVSQRAGMEPAALPPAALWDGLDPDMYDFASVRLTGEFSSDPPVLVFTSLSEPKGEFGGPGWWVMALFELEGGGRVWINRGFVPEGRAQEELEPPPSGRLSVTGLMRRPETGNPFTPPPEFESRRDFLRDPARFSPPEDFPNAVVAAFTIDLDASGAGLPQAGETVLEFPNPHLGYALTWFGLAALTPVLVVAWLWRGRKQSDRLAPPDAPD